MRNAVLRASTTSWWQQMSQDPQRECPLLTYLTFAICKPSLSFLWGTKKRETELEAEILKEAVKNLTSQTSNNNKKILLVLTEQKRSCFFNHMSYTVNPSTVCPSDASNNIQHDLCSSLYKQMILMNSTSKWSKGVIWCDFKFSFLFGVLQAVCA